MTFAQILWLLASFSSGAGAFVLLRHGTRISKTRAWPIGLVCYLTLVLLAFRCAAESGILGK